MNNLISNIAAFVILFTIGWMIAEYVGMKIEKYRAMRMFYKQFKDKGLPDRIVDEVVNSIKMGKEGE